MSRTYRPSVFVVVYRKEDNKIKYLLLRRKLRWKGWEFPKGGQEGNETPMQTVIRELKEETGQYSARITKLNFKGRYDFKKKHLEFPDYKGQEFQLFLAEIEEKNIKIDKREHSSFKWLEFKEALKIIDFPEKKKSLEIADKFLLGN